MPLSLPKIELPEKVVEHKWWIVGGCVAAAGLIILRCGCKRGSGAGTNEAFIFVKPHGQVDAMAPFLESELKAAGLSVDATGELAGAAIDKGGIIDDHYAAIAAYAMKTNPVDLPISAEKKKEFASKYKEDWAAACKQGKVLNLAKAIKELKMDGLKVSQAFEKAKGTQGMKLAPGCYVAYLAEPKRYVINGFYGTMRDEYVRPTAKVTWMRVSWPEGKLSWKDFRGNVLGATDPTQAAATSIRAKVMSTAKALGLNFTPNTGKNCVHGSASPLEALNERKIWLGVSIHQDGFGRQLLKHFSEQQIEKMLQNPIVDGTPLFDIVEDQGSSEVIAALVARKASF